MTKTAPTTPNPGRPPVMKGGRRVNVYLDADSLARAEKLGNGNVSEGIRRALSSKDSMEGGRPRRS